MKVWIVWEIVDAYPEEGGGEYINAIFKNENAAINFCERKKRECCGSDTTFEVSSWPVL